MHRAPPNIAHLTKTAVDAAAPKAKPFTIWDDELKGFGLRVAPSGVKTYVARYRAGGGRAGEIRAFTLGRHGTLTTAQARTSAVKILAGATLNHDPQADRSRMRADITVTQLCDLYVAEGCGLKKAATLATDKSRIEGHIKPLLGAKRVQSVTQADIERFQADVAAGKSAVAAKPSIKALRAKGIGGAALKAADTRKRKDRAPRGGKGAARRTMGLLGAILGFAVARKLRADNPVRGVARSKDGRKQRYLTAEELGRVGRALIDVEAATKGAAERAAERAAKRAEKGAAKEAMAGPAAGATPQEVDVDVQGLAVIRLLFLTGARKSEIEGLRWSEVDRLWGCLRLADSKTGAKIVPVGPVALSVIEAVPRRSNSSPFVFPSKHDPARHYVGTPRVWQKVKALAGLSDARLHDARHTLASLAVGGGQSLPIIGAILGHKDVKTTAQYAHLAASPLKEAVGAISSDIADLLAGNSAGDA
jgi:integrase